MQGTAFLNFVWAKQPRGWVFLARRRGNLWEELPLDLRLQDVVGPKAKGWNDKWDLYFCPNSFKEPMRRKHLCLPSRVMYQDLDESRPEDCPINPDLWWETSPDRYQGLWVLDQVVEPEEFAQLNRALNRACGADPGTWNLTRMLRIPGSFNQKRACRVGRAHQSVSQPGIGIA